MEVAPHLPPDATPGDVVDSLRKYGYAIVDELASSELMDRIAAQMKPYVDRSLHGDDNFVGKLTKRTGAMIARSAAARELVMNPTAIATAGKFLSHASAFQLHLTQVISVFPGSKAQPIHRDQVAWDFFPFPQDYEVQCNLLWAMTDYTEEMGATRVVPGSHLMPDKEYAVEESIPAVMKRGSALFYTGKVYHGAGENKSDTIRQAINITYAVGWVRQEENQYLACPLEVARTLPEDLLKVMGYQMGCFAMGYVGDFEDPMTVIKEPEVRAVFNVDMLQKKSGEAQDAAMLLRGGQAA
ncbi:phytanoyl-CoA dioxygenase family protein [Oleomonas cavernae]|uniref:Phytanoyl-CoA dioxygenase family protein n=1 Tax=Oleomonas cavernae TaxID=2320859 RepID=A0A418WU26_9PROT|nr:phytanoyl-CoA dioxygenase family protein [Oleomonas cavernae]RJF94762.1 phytanoyl-CoA dioxygenase family protein [Oleomonas cavernae]